MNYLPKEILEAWEKRDRACVLTTISKSGEPNTIYVSCCGMTDDGRIMVCNSAFSKTLENLECGSNSASFLFYAPDLAAYQFKGTIKHHVEGPEYEEGKTFAVEDMNLKGVAELKITSAYKGSEKLV